MKMPSAITTTRSAVTDRDDTQQRCTAVLNKARKRHQNYAKMRQSNRRPASLPLVMAAAGALSSLPVLMFPSASAISLRPLKPVLQQQLQTDKIKSATNTIPAVDAVENDESHLFEDCLDEDVDARAACASTPAREKNNDLDVSSPSSPVSSQQSDEMPTDTEDQQNDGHAMNDYLLRRRDSKTSIGGSSTATTGTTLGGGVFSMLKRVVAQDINTDATTRTRSFGGTKGSDAMSDSTSEDEGINQSSPSFSNSTHEGEGGARLQDFAGEDSEDEEDLFFDGAYIKQLEEQKQEQLRRDREVDPDQLESFDGLFLQQHEKQVREQRVERLQQWLEDCRTRVGVAGARDRDEEGSSTNSTSTRSSTSPSAEDPRHVDDGCSSSAFQNGLSKKDHSFLEWYFHHGGSDSEMMQTIFEQQRETAREDWQRSLARKQLLNRKRLVKWCAGLGVLAASCGAIQSVVGGCSPQ
ncbi:unnamed protein product [Amoebophrya sp. A120]|nr:unnamed protein product [Amoebophrya sp. A120]|eukprot:GSA120T00019639001.1